MAIFGGSGVAVGNGAAEGDGVGVGLAALAVPGANATAEQIAAAKSAGSRIRFKTIVSLLNGFGHRTSEGVQLSRVRLGSLDHLGEFRNDLEEVAHDEQVREFANRHGPVAVDRNNRTCRLHTDFVLNCTRDADGDI